MTLSAGYPDLHSAGPDRLRIITGGPGSGKSTLIGALEQRGLRCHREVSRELIRRESSRPGGHTPWSDLLAFSRLAFREMLLQHDHAVGHGDTCFLDRGIPDIFGYLLNRGEGIPEEFVIGHARCRYHATVFILPPWQEIYVNDSERPQSFEEAVSIYRSIREVYESFDYTLVEVPRAPVAERCRFVLSHIHQEGLGTEALLESDRSRQQTISRTDLLSGKGL